VFVASTGKISAVTLLNHYIRYTIPAGGMVQAAADSPGQFLYVLDVSKETGVRLRTFDVATGEVRATRSGSIAPASDRAIAITGALPKLAGAAMAGDGAIYAVTADQHLAVAAPESTTLVAMPWPSEWSGTVVPDGIAAGAGAPSVAIAEQSADGAWLRIFQTN